MSSTALKCPQCEKTINESANRLVQDACGHKKCRSCLLEEDTGCKTCQNTQNNINLSTTSVIKFDPKKLETPETKYVPPVEEQKPEISEKNPETKRCPPKTIPNHIKILTKTPILYKCTICLKTFSTYASVKYHTYCNGVEKPLKCTQCNKGFITRSHLDAHKLKHSGVRPFTCTVCQKSFIQKSKLNRHMKLHTGEKPFVCSVCSKEFSNKDALIGHNRIHNGEKPYFCKYCESRFNNKSNLTKHIATHSKEKIYMCEECGKKFGNKWALATHRKCHSNERPYICQKCTKGFTNIKDLKRHGLIHLDVKPYSCKLCNTKFCRKDNLERHLKNTHSIKNLSEVKSVVSKSQINKKTLDSMAVVKKPNEAPADTYQENPNAINVIINSTISSINHSTPSDIPLIRNAVPVINGPFKLAFKTDAFKNNYNILKREIEPPPRIQTKKPYDMVESLNICQKILSPMNASTPLKPEKPIDCTPKNVIMSVGKVNEKDSLEICKKILQPIDVPPIHYETSFEHEKHAVIKNIKFKLPSTYTNNAIKITENKDFKEIPPKADSPRDYIELQPMRFHYNDVESSQKSVIVNSHTLEMCKKENSFNEIHWRRRISQSIQPKLNHTS